MCNCSLFELPKKKEKYFLFCGAAGYFEVIIFIIRSFELLENSDYQLKLIISGNKEHLEIVENAIMLSEKSDLIQIMSNLEYSQLQKYYMNATALLIPLRNTLQDKARFPHKIGEYLATKNPLITTKIGEIPLYLKHLDNAFVCENYDENEFSDMMAFVINNPELSNEIGQKGYKTGFKYFNYCNYGKPLIDFLS